MSVPSAPLLEARKEPSTTRHRMWLWVLLVLAVVCGSVWGLYPLPDAAKRLESVPRRGPEFDSRDVALTASELTVLGRVNLIHRRYELNGRAFYVTLVDGTQDRHAVHDPRYCFQGAGWKVLDERKLPLPGGEANWVRAINSGGEVQALFWFSTGPTRYTSLSRYWAQTTLRRMTLGQSGPEPVMIVLQSFGHEQPDWVSFAPEVIERLRL
jgi:hypothetical protein